MSLGSRRHRLQRWVNPYVDPIARVAFWYLIGLFFLGVGIVILGYVVLLYPAFFDTPLSMAVESTISFWLETAPYTIWAYYLVVSVEVAIAVLGVRIALIPLLGPVE